MRDFLNAHMGDKHGEGDAVGGDRTVVMTKWPFAACPWAVANSAVSAAGALRSHRTGNATVLLSLKKDYPCPAGDGPPHPDRALSKKEATQQRAHPTTSSKETPAGNAQQQQTYQAPRASRAACNTMRQCETQTRHARAKASSSARVDATARAADRRQRRAGATSHPAAPPAACGETPPRPLGLRWRHT
jgi:hypothetical protein